MKREGVGIMTDKELKLEETEASHTLGRAVKCRLQEVGFIITEKARRKGGRRYKVSVLSKTKSKA